VDSENARVENAGVQNEATELIGRKRKRVGMHSDLQL